MTRGEDEMAEGATLGSALEREHRDIDGGIETFTAGLEAGGTDTQPLVRAMAGLRRHIYLEEEFLFPPLRESGMMMPIFVMLREHGELWNAMARIDELLGASAEQDAVTNACRELLAGLEKHNTKEEPIIYPQADAKLAGDAADELAEFLANGRLPDGWVCESARS
jgi:hemerythrin-like domain-containing protein